MRFLSMVRIDERTGQKPGVQSMEDMGKLMAELMAELAAAGSLRIPPACGPRTKAGACACRMAGKR